MIGKLTLQSSPAGGGVVVRKLHHLTDVPLSRKDVVVRDDEVGGRYLFGQHADFERDHHLGVDELASESWNLQVVEPRIG